jgi:hypothetical protein
MTLEQRLQDALKWERHRTYQETVYWGRQYKMLAIDAIRKPQENPMTIAEKIINYLKNSTESAVTNRRLAFVLAIPEPSVRRATLELEIKGTLYADGNSFNPIYWKLRNGR